MFRSKLLFKNFATSNQIPSNYRPTLSIFASGVASLNCLPFQKLVFDTRNDINCFKKLKPLAKVPVITGGEKLFSKFTDAKCWKCEKYLEVKNFVCVGCGALQHPSQKLNYFDLFGFSQAFDIDLEELSKKFKQLQAVFHPDKYAGKTKAEKDLSETYSKIVNKAYSTLKDPLKRGFYLLALQKYPDCNAPLDQEFLRIVMGKNEELECLNIECALEKFRRGIKEESEVYIATIKQAFKSGNLHEAKHNLSKLTYLTSMDNRAKEKINELQEKQIS